MKTLLVYPEFPETYWSFRHALSFEGKRSAFPPLGLLTISAMLPGSWERRLVDLDALLRIGWRGMVFIVDDNFIGNKRNVKRLLPALADWSERHGHPFSFLTEASVNLAEDDELLEGMRRARFQRVFLGIETPVEASLKEAQKGQNMRRDLLEIIPIVP